MASRPSSKQRMSLWALNLGFMVLSRVSALVTRWLGTLMLYRLRLVQLKPRPGDIYIATAPKVGTTWMQQIVHQLLTGGRGEFDHIYQVAPYLDHLASKPWGERVLDALPTPRVLKTHLLYEQLAPPPDSRVIYVTRNAADALVSLHHHQRMKDGYPSGLNIPFLRGNPLVQAWFAHLESWWPRRAASNVLHVRYEDLVADLEGGIRRVARFLEIPIQEDRMPDILEKCGFAYMKQHNDRFDVRLFRFDGSGPSSSFIRKGVVGEGRTALPPELQAALGDRMGHLRKKLGIGETEV